MIIKCHANDIWKGNWLPERLLTDPRSIKDTIIFTSFMTMNKLLNLSEPNLHELWKKDKSSTFLKESH